MCVYIYIYIYIYTYVNIVSRNASQAMDVPALQQVLRPPRARHESIVLVLVLVSLLVL